MAKIALTMITKDEEATIRQCLESVAGHVDEIVVVDTGSTDATLDIVREFTDKIHHFDWVHDFSAARQYALQQVSDDADWIVWADADDVVENAQNFRTLIDSIAADIDGVVFPYEYQRDPDTGECLTFLSRERLLRGPKGNWKWQGVVHEVIVPSDGHQPKFMVSDAVRYIHHRPLTKDTPSRNLDIIERYIEECDATASEPDPRMVVYLGSELMAQQRWEEASAAFIRYLSISKWEEEKYQATHKLADCYRHLKRYEDAISTELLGFQVRDDWADGYYGLAECYYHLRDWDRVLRWLDRGDVLGPPKTLLITHPLDYSFLPKVFRSVALFNKGKVEEALDFCNQALEIVPHDQQLLHNKEVFQATIRNDKTIQSILNLASELVIGDEPLKALEVLNNVPMELKGDKRVVEARLKTNNMLSHLKSQDRFLESYRSKFERQLVSTSSDDDRYKENSERLLADLGSSSAQRVLQVGCDNIVAARDLALAGHDVVVVDPSKSLISEARDALTGHDFPGSVTFIEGWVEDADGKFDAAFSFDTVQAVPDVSSFLNSLERSVVSGGIVAVTFPDGVYDREKTEKLGLTPYRESVRVVTRPYLTDLIYQLDLGLIKSSYRDDSDTGYVSFSTTRPLQRDITIWCPFSYEPWGPQSLETGIGGSEEAVIHMAKELTDIGYRVTVYGGWEGAHDWVLYHNYTEFDPDLPRDIVVIWRTPVPLDYDINANSVYVWMHDVPRTGEFTEERLGKVKKIWVLSEWHRNCLPNVPDEKIEIIRNGVNILPVLGGRDTNKVVWGSSPDRGLDCLLAVWPEVVKEVPDAKLHCFYGFEMYDRFGRPQEFKNKILEAVNANEDSIVWHGRVGQGELWKHFSTAGIWAYPTYFDEISCITAMRAQITGAWPVVIPKAALSETVRYGTKVEHDITSSNGLEAFKEALIYELKNPVSIETRSKMMDDSSEFFTWKAVANLWRERFCADEAESLKGIYAKG